MQETLEMRNTSLFDVIRDLRHDFKNLVHDEIQLAKTEVARNIRKFGKNAVWLAVGAAMACTGLLILLAGLGALLAFAFRSAGLSSEMSWFLGLLLVSVASIAAGAVFVLKAIKMFSHASLKPERTVQTIQHLRGNHNGAETKPVVFEEPKEDRRSPEQLESDIDATRNHMEKRLEELSERLKPSYVGKRLARQVKAHPIRSSLIGAGTGLASYLAIKRRMHNHHK